MQPAVNTKVINQSTMYQILFAISLGHLLNDSMQAVVPAIFPILEKTMNLTYTEIGFIAFALNMTSSVMQPVFGIFSDRKPSPFLLPIGMASSLLGMLSLAFAPNLFIVLLSVLLIGIGSAIFHPEGSKVAFLASGSKRGLSQAIYQVGGNTGNSLAPIFTALIFVPLGQKGAAWFTILAAIGICVLIYVSTWYRNKLKENPFKLKSKGQPSNEPIKITSAVKFAIILLVFITFARSWYSAGIGNYYQFYLIKSYGLSIKSTQLYLFIFMIAGVIGTFIGGTLADRFGKRNMILFSLVGTFPLALLLPHISLLAVIPILFLIGIISSSSFSVIVVYAQELVPGKVGLVSGLIVGLAFGMGALGAVLLGVIADATSLNFVMNLCSFLPLLGLVAFMLPNDRKKSA
ncbi:MFS transporter [Gottfriedia acidiceleris]|uniref:MFS transporter n=1 Tax=Gottfriedia acidiceleris TaxID=371036 RepID=A0ABY4JHJ3_9BACI|nr:MFS transporter [Gottfriedia acidiceleris]UPM53291.1 MFS transporter [Gottfriedia acidiceleris]